MIGRICSGLSFFYFICSHKNCIYAQIVFFSYLFNMFFEFLRVKRGRIMLKSCKNVCSRPNMSKFHKQSAVWDVQFVKTFYFSQNTVGRKYVRMSQGDPKRMVRLKKVLDPNKVTCPSRSVLSEFCFTQIFCLFLTAFVFLKSVLSFLV